MPSRNAKSTATKATGGTISPAHALKFLLSSTQDPNHLGHCGTCLNGAFVECTSSDAKTAPDLRTKIPTRINPELWNAIVALLFSKRTDEQMKCFLVHLSGYRCQMDQEEGRILQYHPRGEWNGMPILETLFNEALPSKIVESDAMKRIKMASLPFILNLFCMLSIAVENSHLRSAAKGSSNSWPISLADLIPFGADNFVETILQWYQTIPHTVVFRLTGNILRVCQMLVIPSLIKYRFIDTVVESTRKMADCTLAVETLKNKSPSLSERSENRFYIHFADVFVYFQTCMHDVLYDCRAGLFRGRGTKAMQLCSILLYLDDLLSSPIDHSGFNPRTIANYGQDLFRFFHMHMPPRPSMPVHPLVYLVDCGAFPPPASCRAPKESAMTTIKIFRTETRCSAQGCSNTLQSVGRSFQRCGRCGVVSYCGRECQTKAWREERYPHKRVCPALRTLMEKGGGSALFFENLRVGEGYQRFHLGALPTIYSNWQRADISDEDLTLIEEWNKMIMESRGYPLPDGTEWTPGYDDYNNVIAQLCASKKCTKPKYLNRLARWPSEVAKEERLLKI